MSGDLANILKNANNITIDKLTNDNRRILKESSRIYNLIGGFYNQNEKQNISAKKQNGGTKKKQKYNNKKKKTLKKKKSSCKSSMKNKKKKNKTKNKKK